jgi:hypothetical protein
MYDLLRFHWDNPKLRRKSIYFEGASGIGKSETITEFARDVAAELRDERVSTMEPVDLRGSLWRGEDGFTTWAPPKFLKFDPDSEGILLLDEITSASREMFAGVYGLFLERRLSGVPVPDKWMLLAAGNRLSDRGVVNQMPAPLLNRFVKIDVKTNIDSWRDKMGQRKLDHRMISWISDQPQFLHNFEDIAKTGTEPFCTPRSIVSAADYLDLAEAKRVELFIGCLGKEGAASLESHLRLFHKLPSLTAIKNDPEKCRIPDEKSLGERYALAMMCSGHMDRNTFDPLWRYVDRMGAMLVVLAVRLAFKRDPSVAVARGYSDFTLKHNAVFTR